MKKKVLIFIIILFIPHIEISAQLNTTTIGNAADQGDNCFLITNNLQSQKGGVWYDNPIDFSNDFTINYQNNFGDNDSNGADGMALVFKTTPDAVIGDSGGGLGYQSIDNSLIVEFDTWNNGSNGDLSQDHMSIMKNGNPSHNSVDNLAGPVWANSSNANIEDGNFHEIKIEWDAAAQVFSVFFDCELRLTLTQDIKNTIFFGDSTIYFGFVGSTGWARNLQQVCFNEVSFVENMIISEDETICLGEEITIDATIPSGTSYSWSPETGVSNSNIANPTFSPTETTNYIVTINDNCGEQTTHTVTINVTPTITPTFTQVAPICDGETLSNLPTTSTNNLSGSWSPAMNNMATTTYTFTPDTSETCTEHQTMTITVNPIITPTFTQVAPICSGGTLSNLPTSSTNNVVGIWSPAMNNTITTTYTFTSETCAENQSMTIKVNPIITLTFAQVAPICKGETLSNLPTTSTNNVEGSWSPAMNNMATTTYTFTPDASETCAENQVMTITVNPIVITFTQIEPICYGETLSDLPTTSTNNVSGSWSPAMNNTASTTYTFTPDASETCAENPTMTITVNPTITPTFTQVAPICSGDTLSDLPTSSTNKVEGSWSPAMNNTITTTYTFTPDASETCAENQSMTIRVNPIVTPTFVQVAPICSGETLSNLPTSSTNNVVGIWLPAMNNTITTTYTFTPDASETCAENQSMTIRVNPIITPVFNSVDPICSLETLADLPTTSLNNVVGTWWPAIDNTATTSYTFTPKEGPFCAELTTLEIVVNEISTINMILKVVLNEFNNSQSIEISVVEGKGSYEYKVNNGSWQDSNLFENLVAGKYFAAVRKKIGCGAELNNWILLIDYPRFFTPNNDGINDAWQIKGLETQPETIITIFDRYGAPLSVFRAGSFGWNGIINGKKRQSNDYWFQVQYLEMENRTKTVVSHFSLLR